MLPSVPPLGANAASRTGVADAPFACKICGYPSSRSQLNAFGAVRGNTTRFSRETFRLWKCPECLSIHSMDPVDFQDIYSDYPLNRRHLDVFARGTLHNLLGRLKENGLGKTNSILDYGCGNGLLIQYLNEQGYANVAGYDPYVERFASPQTGRQFDWVIANDVIEHVADPKEMVRDCAALGKPGGMLYIGTADSEPVQMTVLEPHVMRLHQPFHRVMITQATLNRLGVEVGLGVNATYRRSYMDTWRPFSNYRFLDEFNKELGHDLDLALDPAAGKIVARRPKLLFYAFLGYFFPVAFEPAVVLRLPV